MLRNAGATTIALALALAATACTTTAQTADHTDASWLDDPAASPGLDRRDLQEVFEETATSLTQSRFYRYEASAGHDRKTIAILPMGNATSARIDGELHTLLATFEGRLSEAGGLRVVSPQERDRLVAEVDAQTELVFEPASAAALGRRLGARFVVTGKVFDQVERAEDAHHVQYFLIVQVVEVETGEVRWSEEAALSRRSDRTAFAPPGARPLPGSARR